MSLLTLKCNIYNRHEKKTLNGNFYKNSFYKIVQSCNITHAMEGCYWYLTNNWFSSIERWKRQ